MFNILVLDDNPVKQQRIREVIISVAGLSEDNITVAADIITAKRELIDKNFDLLLLDIQIPNRFDQSPKNDGGITFLKELVVSKRYQLPANIIGITAHEELFGEVKGIFDNQLLALIKFENNSDNWSESLKRRVEHLVQTNTLQNTKTEQKYEYDIAVLCALEKVELEGLKQLSTNWSVLNDPSDENTNYYTCNFENGEKKLKIVAASSSQMGMTASAVLSMKLIQLFRPRYLVMTGIAAGIKGKVNIGDILVADQSWDYGSGKIVSQEGTREFRPDPNPIRLKPSLRAKIQLLAGNSIELEEIKSSWPSIKPNSSLTMHIGPVASGAAVVSYTPEVDIIVKNNRNLIGIEMENYAVFYAAENCSNPQPRVFTLKSVCDFADEEKNDNFQHYAAYTSASVLRKLALDYLEF